MALRAGIELLGRIGAAVDATGVGLHMSTFDYGSSLWLHVSMSAPDGSVGTGLEGVSLRLAGLRAVADALGLPLTVTYDTPEVFGLHIELNIDGVWVRVWDHFTGDGVPPARATFAGTTSTDVPADDSDLSDGAEPTPADLAAITAEAPLIAAELAVVDAEVAVASDGESRWTARRLTAARRNLSTVATGFTPAGPDTFRPITPLSFHPTLRSA